MSIKNIKILGFSALGIFVLSKAVDFFNLMRIYGLVGSIDDQSTRAAAENTLRSAKIISQLSFAGTILSGILAVIFVVLLVLHPRKAKHNET